MLRSLLSISFCFIVVKLFFFVNLQPLFSQNLGGISLIDDEISIKLDHQDPIELNVLENDENVPPLAELVLIEKDENCGTFKVKDDKIIFQSNGNCKKPSNTEIEYGIKEWESIDSALVTILFTITETDQEKEEVNNSKEEEVKDEESITETKDENVDGFCKVKTSKDEFETDFGEAITMNVLANDNLCDKGVESLEIDIEPYCGTFEIEENNEITFLPDNKCSNIVPFSYKILGDEDLTQMVELKINEFTCPENDFGNFVAIPAQEIKLDEIRDSNLYFSKLISSVIENNLLNYSDEEFSIKNKPFCILERKLNQSNIPDDFMDSDEIQFESCNNSARNDIDSAKGIPPIIAFELVEDYFEAENWNVSIPTIDNYLSFIYFLETNIKEKKENEFLLMSLIRGVKEITSSKCEHNDTSLVLGSNCKNEDYRGYCVNEERLPNDFGFRIMLNK